MNEGHLLKGPGYFNDQKNCVNPLKMDYHHSYHHSDPFT